MQLSNQLSKCKEKKDFLWLNFKKLIILAGNNIDVVATPDDELANLPQKVRRGSRTRITNNPVQGRLHRTCWNLKWLQEIGANAHCHDNGHQNDFAILPPMRLPRHRCQPGKSFIQRIGCAVYSLAISLP